MIETPWWGSLLLRPGCSELVRMSPFARKGLREESSVQQCLIMKDDASGGIDDVSDTPKAVIEAGAKKKKDAMSGWDIRRNIAELHGLEAARAYDRYLADHRRRLRELQAIAG